jgi:hypothetical protein
MTTNISHELVGGVDTIAVSERAKRQIGSQASESKANSADTKLRGTYFIDSFPDTAPATRYRKHSK